MNPGPASSRRGGPATQFAAATRSASALRLRKLVATKLRGAAGNSAVDLQLLGKVLLHAALVGGCVGIVGVAFVMVVDTLSELVLRHLCGYRTLRAAGEGNLAFTSTLVFRPWLMLVVPGIGGAFSGMIAARFAPETFGGGTDTVIDAFHNKGGILRKRVPFVKFITSVFTLASGGAGGREGPTMLIGGSIGSLVGRVLHVTTRERRILLVAGTAAGISAVFRTPLGAALLAVEVLSRDDFESDALVPSVLASVVAYSVSIAIFGETTLFARAAHYPFVPAHLPFYALLAVVICIVAMLFCSLLQFVHGMFGAWKIPRAVKPAVGGILLGLLVTPLVMWLGPFLGSPGQGLGLFGGGYGAAQVAIVGAPWLPHGWNVVELLLLLALAKMVATSLTVGSGGSAGDFGPSLVIGGLIGGSFGHGLQMLTHDPRIDPGAFALVGMGTFYGGIAHVPLAALVLVCELAGSYDLLVPLMLSEGIAFILLRKHSLYHKQVARLSESPAHRADLIFDVLRDVLVRDIVVRDRPFISFTRRTTGTEVKQAIARSEWQDTFPVMSEDGVLEGIVRADILRLLTSEPEMGEIAVVDDFLESPFFVQESDNLHDALDRLLMHHARETLVLDADGAILGFLDEAEITRVYQTASAGPPSERIALGELGR